jgi:hypothetical protein
MDWSPASESMPYFVEIDHERKRFFVIGRDPVGLSDVIALLDRQVEEGAWPYGSIHDSRLVTWMPSREDVIAIVIHIAAIVTTHGPRGPVALVASSQTLFGIARMYTAIAEGSKYKASVFRNLEDASRWLDAACAVPSG